MTDAISRAMLTDNRRGLFTHELRAGYLRRFRVLFLALAVLLGNTSVLHAATATWNANPETDIAGYILSYGTSPGVHPTSVDVKNVTMWQISTLTAGQTYYFVVQAYNTSAMTSVASAEVAFTVPAATPPTLTQPANQTSAQNATVSLQLVGSDPDGDVLSYSATGLPAALTVNAGSGLISGTLTASAAVYSVTATVSDGALTNSKTFTWTVTVATPPPTITGLSQTSGPVGMPVTISGTNFGATQGTSTNKFNGTAGTATSWSAASIVVPVPNSATTGMVVVTVGGVASNGISFTVTVPPPSLTSLSPTSGAVGTPVTIAGANFGTAQGTSTVKFNGIATTATSWSGTSISVPVPSAATTGTVVVTVGGVASNGISFTVVPTSGVITLTQHQNIDAGTIMSASLAFSSNNTAGNFIAVAIRAGGSSQVFSVTDSRGNSYQQATQVNNGTDDTLGIYYAQNIAGGANTVTVSDAILGTMRFAILEYSGIAAATALDRTVAAQGIGTTPTSGSVVTTGNGDLLFGAISTANGMGFAAGSGYTIQDSVPAAPGAKLTAEDGLQGAAGSASATATLAGSDNWAAALAAFRKASTPAPSLTSLNPTTGMVGTAVTIAGANFGATQGTSTVTFNGIAATIAAANWSATSIAAPVPTGATTGNVVVTVGGQASNGLTFTVTVPPPTLTSLSPSSGAVGTAITIAGANFGTAQGTSTVKFNGIATTATIWSATSISAPVPSAATTGAVVVTVGGLASNGISFTVTPSAPSLTSLNPTSGAVGGGVTIAGVNFGTTQGTSTVTFNGIAATPTAWGGTSISVPVPSAATTGPVVVTVGGLASNGISFTVTSISGTITIDLTPQDTYLNLDSINYSTAVTLKAYTWNANQVGNAILMKFGLSQIPATATIQSATVVANLVGVDAFPAEPTYAVALHKIINHNPDPTTATGNTYDGVNAWTANTCCFNNVPMAQADISAVRSTTAVDRTLGFKTWDATTTVQEWLTTPATNFGLLLNADVTKGADHFRAFASMKNSTTTARPYLHITYTTSSPATLTSPTNGATNVDMTLPMQWTTAAGAQAYYLYGGSALGTNNLINTGEIQQTSYLATGLPASQTVFARLWTKLGGAWLFSDSSFTTAATTVPVVATLTSPVNGATNVDMTLPVQWTTIASAQAYYLYVGSTLGANDLVNTGEIQQTSYLATGLPHSQAVFARLWTKVGGVWRFSDSSFTTAP